MDIREIIENRGGPKMREHIVRLAAGCVFLWIAAVPDIRSKKIPVWIPALFAAAALAVNLFLPTCIGKRELWAGALPGAFLLLLCCLFRGQLGEGDGICLMVSGLLTGLAPAVVLTEAALVLAAAAGVLCICTKHKRAGDRIAFIPFLASAQTLILAAEMVKEARIFDMVE